MISFLGIIGLVVRELLQLNIVHIRKELVMRSSHTRLVLLIIVLLVWLSASQANVNVYNLKLLSNHAPDLTDLKSFCYSTTSRWQSNDEKAAALAHWFGVMEISVYAGERNQIRRLVNKNRRR